ncbi:MAG: hypothetical protein US42_C0019G0009 [Candidatus Magasanikbacteria bacterium GW2011_GWC2_37_14]|uniref:LTD domain-containing protein n=1 Tax=Candidatus Magasanikbacteria bacterium GW2011_GWC2_37_14 TaxID=1619046 RepID=A0A0G0IRV0_9BACT|nr:MAG: hypothetical protein US42_C0019G0009 [Candidatus Magasanikbacteria bacterium GW2011_GWC2_37_14]
MKKFVIIILFFIFGSIFFIQNFAKAIIINQIKIGASGTGNSTKEYIELYNPEVTEISLANWQIYKFTKSATTSADKILLVTLPAGTIIPAAGYFLISHSDYVSAGEFDTPDLIYSEQSLASNNTVVLTNNLDENIDLVGYGEATAYEGSAPASDPGTKAIIRNNFLDSDENNTDFLVSSSLPFNSLYISNTSTPPIEEPTTTPSSTPQIGKILINEFVPYPESGSEWVELYNPNDFAVDINGWQLFDGVSSFFTATNTILAKSFYTVALSSSKLNNSGDIILLKNNLGEVIDQVCYGVWEDYCLGTNPNAPKKGNSLARKIAGGDTDEDNIDFAETIEPTFGMSNVIDNPALVSSGSYFYSGYTPSHKIGFGEIQLNEIFPNPLGVDDNEEFIELKNYTSEVLDLSNLQLRDASGAKYTIPSGVIQPNSLLVFKRSQTKIALNNSGEEAVYLYSPANLILDKISYTGNNQESIAFAKNSDGDWQWTKFFTPEAKNIFNLEEESEIVTSASETILFFAPTNNSSFLAIISEFLPNPIGSDEVEFIELFNPSDTTTSLFGYYLDDSEDGSSPYTFTQNDNILPHSYLIINKEISKLALNNDTDSVRLLDSNKEVIEEIEYEGGEEGFSYALINNEWLWTNNLTLGQENIGPDVVEEIKNTIDTAKTAKYYQPVLLNQVFGLEVGDIIKTTGIVAVAPGVFSSQYFYLVNNDAGLQIYMNNKDFPDLKVGQIIEVRGELSYPGGNWRLKVKNKSDIKVIGNSVLPEMSVINIAELEENLLGSLVTVQGQITELKSGYLYLDDDSQEIKVVFKKGANIENQELLLGKELKVSGIVNNSKNGFEIWPRNNNDLTIINTTTISQSVNNESSKKYLEVTVGGFISLVIGFAAKARGRLAWGIVKKVGKIAFNIVRRTPRV